MHDEAETRFFRLLEGQHGIARTRQAQKLGLPPERLRWWIRRGRLRRVEYGIVAAAGAPITPDFEAMHGVLIGGHGLTEGVVAALAGPSAAHRLGLVTSCPDFIHVVSTRQVHRDQRLSRHRFHFHRTGRLPGDEVILSRDIPITEPIRTFLDFCAAEAPWRAKNLYYRGLRTGCFNAATVLKRIESETRQGRAGLRLAREIALRTTPGAEKARSGWEEIVYEWIIEAGLPRPERNVLLPSSFGFSWEIDLLYRSPPIAVEISPWDTHGDPHTYRKDLKKRADLEALGYKVIVVSDLEDRMLFLKELGAALKGRT